MDDLRDDVRDELRHIALGLAGVAVCCAIALAFADSLLSLPVALLLLPVLALALWAGPVATGVTALSGAAIGAVLLMTHEQRPDDRVRFASLVIGCGLATALAVVRRRREDALAAQRTELELARRREESERLMAAMLDRLPELSGADTVDDLTDLLEDMNGGPMQDDAAALLLTRPN